jgi:nicotinamidase-related amidase
MPRRRIRKSELESVFDQKQPIYDCVVVDVNTQKDFLSGDGILQVKSQKDILERTRMLMEWAKSHRVPVISPVDVHRPMGDEAIRSPLFNCIEGTPGQQKIPFTLLPKRLVLEHDSGMSLPDNLLENYLQIVIHKKTNDVFTNPKADRLFSRLQARRFLIFGVGMERAIKHLGLGLLSRGKNPIIVVDACGTWDDEAAELAVRQLEAKGAILMSTSEVLTLEPGNLPEPHIEQSADTE